MAWSRGTGWSTGVRDQRKDSHSASREHLLTTEVGTKGGGTHTHTPRSLPAKQSSVWDSLVPVQALLIKHTAATPYALWDRERFQQLRGEGGGAGGEHLLCEETWKSNLLIAWGKHLGRTPPDHQWCGKWKKTGGMEEAGDGVDAEWAVG